MYNRMMPSKNECSTLANQWTILGQNWKSSEVSEHMVRTPVLKEGGEA